MPDIKILTEVGALGIVAWIVFHVFRTGLPMFVAEVDSQRKSHAEESERQRGEFKKILETQLQNHTTVMRECNERHRHSMEKATDRNESMLDKIRVAIEKLELKMDQQSTLLYRHDMTVRGTNDNVIGSALIEEDKDTKRNRS